MGLRPRPGTNSVCRQATLVSEECFDGGQRWPKWVTRGPSRGLARSLKQHLCTCCALVAVVVVPVAKNPRIGMRTKESLTDLEARLTHKSAQQTQPRTGWTRRCGTGDWLGRASGN